MSNTGPTYERKVAIEKVEAVGWEFEVEDGASTVAAALTYTDEFSGWLSRLPAFKSPHPDIPQLVLKKFKGSRLEGGMISVQLSYEWLSGSGEYPGRPANGPAKRYHIEPGSGEEPLLTNKFFRDLPDAEKQAAVELAASSKTAEDFTKAAAILTSDVGKKFIEKIRKGIEAYRGLGVVWVERFTTDTLADVALTKIFKTTSDPPGNCPDVTANFNWLRLPPGVSARDDGKSWDIENRWELSLYGKWDPDLYPAGG